MIKPVLIRDMLYARREVPFYNQIDLIAIEDDIVIGATGNMTVGYRLEAINLMLKSRQELVWAVEFLRRSLGHLPQRTQYQFVLQNKPGAGRALYEYRDGITAKDAFSKTLVQTKVNALREDSLFNTQLYLFITKLNEEKQNFRGKILFLNKKARAYSQEAYLSRKEELLSARSHLENLLGNLKIGITSLKAKDFENLFYFHLNPTRATGVKLGKAGDDPMHQITLRSSLLYLAPVVERDFFYQDEFYFQGINLVLPPQSTDIQALGKMLDSLELAYDFTLSIYVPDQERQINRLKTQANVSKTFGFLASAKNYDALAKYSEIDSLITEIKSSSQKLAYYSLSFLIRDRQYQGLKTKHNKILEAFPCLGSAEGIVDHMNHDRLFLSFLPGQAWMNPRRYLIQTDALANILPIQSEWQGSSKAMVLLKTRKHQLLKLDLFDEILPAKHGIIVGTTGSGKSFTTNYLLTSYLLENDKNQLVIIDVGKSYRRLASLLGGAYLDIDLGENYAINPLLNKALLYKYGELDSENLSYLVLLAEKLSKGRPEETLTNAQKSILERAILRVYEKKDAPILSDLLEVLRNYSMGDEADKHRAQEFAKNLSVWTEGRYGKLLNRQGNIDTTNRFIVFELGKLDAHPDLQAIVFFVIRTAIANKLNQRDTKKVIVIDEGWRFFNDDTGARLIEDLYRTSRKFNGLVLSISQSPEDFLNTKAASAIIGNSFTKYILKLNKGHELLSRFELNDSEVNEVKTLVSKPGYFSEVLVKYADNSVVARIEPTSLEYWLATTSPEDLKLEEQMRTENPALDNLQLIEQLAAKYPRGGFGHAQSRR